MESRLILKPGREKSLRHRHPWVFSGAIERVEGEPGFGETVAVVAHDGSFLARAAYNAQSQIRARVWSFDERERVDVALLRSRLTASIARRSIVRPGSDGQRLVHGESDGLPGVVIDRYAETAVVQILAAGAERWRESWGPMIAEVARVESVYERSDAEVRTLEGLQPRVRLLHGEAPGAVRIVEDGVAYEVDVA